jgi:hypothetical protein
MTNIEADPQKNPIRTRLFEIGKKALEKDGWRVSKVTGAKKGSGKGSVRLISRGSEIALVSIRTTQDRAIAFPRNPENNGWSTLEDVDYVCAVSVDNAEDPREAWAHFIPQKEMVERFDRAYLARTKAGRVIPNGRGVWLSLYQEENDQPVDRVGAGAGRPEHYPPMFKAPLWAEGEAVKAESVSSAPPSVDAEELDDEAPLTIAEAKRRLAKTFGVDPSCIKISIEA